jgi:hypothetical protein
MAERKPLVVKAVAKVSKTAQKVPLELGDSSSTTECGENEAIITLTPYFQSNYEINGAAGFRIRVVASLACGLDHEIFRYYQKPPNPSTGETPQVFSGVCSWVDMADLPADAPNEVDNPKLFRLPYFDIVVASVDVAYDVWDLVVEETQALLNAVVKGQFLEVGTAVSLSGTTAG